MSEKVLDNSSVFEEIFAKISDKKYSHIRQGAFRRFVKAGIPGLKNEEYKYFHISKHLPEFLNIFDNSNLGKNFLPENFSFISEDNANHFVFINGKYCPHLSKVIENDRAFDYYDIAGDDLPDDKNLAQYFEERLNLNHDPFIDLNSAFLNYGLVLHVKNNSERNKFFIYYISDPDKENLFINTSSLILLEKQSSAEVTEVFYSTKSKKSFSVHLSEIFAKRESKLNIHQIQDIGDDDLQVNNTNLVQSQNSFVNSYTFPLKGKMIRNNLNIFLDDPNCESHLYGLYYVTGNQIIDNHTTVDHRKPNCFSNEYYKGIIDDRGTGIFNGKIYVRPDAQKTNAFQSNKNIVLSDNATIYTKPQLEIWADDVKCSHGATTGQIDREQLFYLKSRGLDESSARALLLHAFAFEIIEKIDSIPVRKYLEEILNKQLGYYFNDK